ncbi:MAG: TolC family protein [Spirochaetaceae bacterium]|nr:TolC family protein [Spirochaetaceae bacterium]
MNKRNIALISLLIIIETISAQSPLYTAEELYELALENSSALTEKTARERAAGYRVREAFSRGGPTVDFETTMSYITNPDTLTVEAGTLGTLPPQMGALPMPMEDTVFEMSGNTFYNFRLIVNQPLFTWGKIFNALQATKEGAAAAVLDTIKTKDQLKTEIRINCLSLHHLKEIELAVSRQSEIASRLEKIASDSYKNGMILQTEFLDAQVKRKEADLTGNMIKQQIDQVTLNLTYLTGTELTPVMIETRELQGEIPDSWEEIFRKAQNNNRDLSMLRHSISAEEYKSKIQKGDYYFKPDLAFHMELSYSGSYFPLIQEEWHNEDKGNLTLTLAIQSPIADFGGMYASGKAVEEELKALKASYENSIEQIEQFIRQTISLIELNKMNIDYYSERIEIDLQMMNQKEKEWLSGYGDEKDFLIHQISYYSDIILLNQELISLGRNYYKLENLQGNVDN